MKPKVAQKVIPLETPVHPPSWGIVPNKFSLSLSLAASLSLALALSLLHAHSLSQLDDSWTVRVTVSHLLPRANLPALDPPLVSPITLNYTLTLKP